MLDDTPTVLDHLLKNYGKVRSEDTPMKETEVVLLARKLGDPLVLLKRLLENLHKMVTQTGIPCADQHKLKKCLI